ncbi:hypothetical protein CQA49_02415 [Helicobacter sp. MIT 00-7814]|uniref:hypothetical protein n=1 Tax=unclassified Helicobacter TaxID=2593540 RepID=UPI000E1F0604|nr:MULTISPECIES: hypothetical protein [unclassified Helicobacter]RDU55243.1 hypothetical protein CQA37_04105 [Helicobacter sp. MIT 99-10781]RDU56081.1 hypothetical protein CQA49_02415 [Helicobacter sp. MIT 00-7814]
MKKFLLWLFGIIFALVALLFVALFTPIGNNLFKPLLQAQIDKYAPLKLELETFKLRFNSIDVLMRNEENIIITLGGDFSLFSQDVDLALKVDARDISIFGELVETPLSGSFTLEALAQGNIHNLSVRISSDIARSFSLISAFVKDFSLESIKVDIRNLQIQEALAMVGQKPYASGLLGVEADIKGNENLEFNGRADVKITQGALSQNLIKKDFGAEIPKINFTNTLALIFDMDKVAHTLQFSSNAGVIESEGKTTLENLFTNSTYSVNLSNLALFTPLAGMPLRGDFKTQGNALGAITQNLDIQGVSNVADSKTSYALNLKNLAPNTATLGIKDLQIHKALWILNMPQYAKGTLTTDIDASNLANKLNATINAQIKGSTENAVMKKEFELDMPKTPFTLDISADIKELKGNANALFSSPLATLEAKPITLDLEKITFSAPYALTLPDLGKLQFATKLKLVGKILAQGKFSFADSLFADFHTQSLGGDIRGELKDSQISAKLDSVNTLSLLKMLNVNQIFSSTLFGDFVYDTKISQGTLKASMKEGRILENELTKNIKRYLNFDMTGEVYKDITLSANIDEAVIDSAFSLASKNTTISSERTKLDLEKESIDSKISVGIKENKVDVYLTNALSKPSVRLDAKNLLIQSAQKEVGKQVEKLLEDEKTKQKIQEGSKKLLKGLFK